MPSIILTALSIMILAFAIVAGTNFVNPAMQSRIEVARVLSTQYAAIRSASSAYRMENQGVRPSSMREIEGYVADGAVGGFGTRTEHFSWSIEPGISSKPVLCLSFVGGQVDYGILSGFERFAIEADAQRPGTVTFGDNCSSPSVAITPDKIATHLNETGTALSIRFEEN
jgi:hypothetical protein